MNACKPLKVEGYRALSCGRGPHAMAVTVHQEKPNSLQREKRAQKKRKKPERDVL